MKGRVAGHDFYLHEGMCVGKCERQVQGRACICGCLSCSWAIISFICVGLCEGKSRAEHVCM